VDARATAGLETGATLQPLQNHAVMVLAVCVLQFSLSLSAYPVSCYDLGLLIYESERSLGES
jgi:hypothetical protein